MKRLCEDYGLAAFNLMRQIDHYTRTSAAGFESLEEHLVSLEEHAVKNATAAARVARRINPDLRGER